MYTYLLFNIYNINLLFAVGGLITAVLTVALLYDHYYNNGWLVKKTIAAYLWPLLALTTIGGVAITLLYSEVFGFIPCSLCWLQRIALYPQALLVLIALHQKDTAHFPVYGMALSAFGFIVAIYQYLYQALPQEVLESGSLFCLTDGSADCSETIMQVFGFVTFPFLSAVLFALLLTLYLHLYKQQKSE